MPTDTTELRARLRAGDEKALADAFARFREPLRRMVTAQLHPLMQARMSASDVLQEVYLDAAQRLPHYLAKSDQSLFGWLRLLVGQRLHDVYRQHVQTQARAAGLEIPLERGRTPAASSLCLAAQLAGRLPSPSQEAICHERHLHLQAALEQMDDVDREVLCLRHFEELSNKDAAQALGIPPAAASKRYVRALARLKDYLETSTHFASASSEGRNEIIP